MVAAGVDVVVEGVDRGGRERAGCCVPRDELYIPSYKQPRYDRGTQERSWGGRYAENRTVLYSTSYCQGVH